MHRLISHRAKFQHSEKRRRCLRELELGWTKFSSNEPTWIWHIHSDSVCAHKKERKRIILYRFLNFKFPNCPLYYLTLGTEGGRPPRLRRNSWQKYGKIRRCSRFFLYFTLWNLWTAIEDLVRNQVRGHRWQLFACGKKFFCDAAISTATPKGNRKIPSALW